MSGKAFGAGVVGVVSALAATPGAQATPISPAVPVATSYAELLEPIPNAVERLELANAADAEHPPVLMKAQYAVDHHHHHHHHHYRRHRRHWRPAPPPAPHHHHHHHHQQP